MSLENNSTTALMLGPVEEITQMANLKGRIVLKPQKKKKKKVLHSLKDKSAIKKSKGSMQRLELVGAESADTEGAKVVQVEDIKRKLCVFDSSNVENTVAEKKTRLDDAVSLGFEGENLLDEAMEFTTMHLKDLKGDVSKTLKEEVRHSLEIPLHRRMRRLEQRWYIDAYNMKEAHNRKLLELARLDFNIVQSVHQRDLKDMSRWWKEMDLGNKLSFARDRLMECFFWTVGMVFEPQFSNCRKGLTKVTSLITIIDDVYDVYATLEELEMFTDIVQSRWDVKALKDLPEYMKLCFLALYNTVNEMVYDTLKEQGVDILPYLTKAWGDLCKAFLQETKWRYYKRAPSSEDYLNNAWMSASGALLLVHAYFLMSQRITNRALEGLEDYHNLLRWPSIIFRLCNDLGTSMAELERGETANSILCYMRETSLSEDFAREHISNLIDKTWKKMNKDRFSDSPFEEPFLETAINLARISHCTYQHGDGHATAVKRWRPYLVGKPFIVKTERQSLKFLLEQRIATPAQQKWLAKLLGYAFVVEYKKDVENKVADALSRKSDLALMDSQLPLQLKTSCLFLLSVPDPTWLVVLKDSYSPDPSVKQLISSIQSGKILSILNGHLHVAQERIKSQAVKHRQDRSFVVGDWVYLRLQSYRQKTLAYKGKWKLSPMYFGPFKVLQKVGSMSYRLDLPPESKIHHVFHVSYLKLKLGQHVTPLPTLPLVDDEE
ncbi:hypothetical protein SO802_034273 [Lithocarpus litseifolius]|uniref:Uncharacterized protein n=1 Tax=Lithocarpus litseifolius TaxID=425828 RepID=A0AAW2BH40_9ROSI